MNQQPVLGEHAQTIDAARPLRKPAEFIEPRWIVFKREFEHHAHRLTRIYGFQLHLPHQATGYSHPGESSAGSSVQVAEEEAELVAGDVLSKLANLQYFASVSGGRIFKGRFPILLANPAPGHP